MNTSIVREFTNLGIWLLVTLLVWRYYKGRRFDPAERYSTFGPRFWTGFVDGCVLWPIGFITSALFSLNVPKGLAALLIIVESLAWLVYTVVMHARFGQTVGKMVTKVQVVDFRTEGRISWRQAWLREGIPMLLSLGLGVSLTARSLARKGPSLTNRVREIFTHGSVGGAACLARLHRRDGRDQDEHRSWERPARRCTECRPSDASGQFSSPGGAAIGDLIVRFEISAASKSDVCRVGGLSHP